MRVRAITFAFFVVLSLIGALAALAPSALAGEDDNRAREDQMALLVGRSRVDAGMLPLARSAALNRAAESHARDMVDQRYMEHEGLDGSTPASRAADQGYATPPGGAWLVVEVISAMGDAPDAAMGWWLGDGLHRRVVLRSYWREVGIGYAPGGPYGRFWVVLFGCRPNVLPPVLLDGMLAIPDEACGGAAGRLRPRGIGARGCECGRDARPGLGAVRGRAVVAGRTACRRAGARRRGPCARGGGT